MESVNIGIGTNYNLTPAQIINIEVGKVLIGLGLNLNATAKHLD